VVGIIALLSTVQAEFWLGAEERPVDADERGAAVCMLLQLPRNDLARCHILLARFPIQIQIQ
jgi:hypothetical protein